jgi:hypothetical protein
VTVVKLPGTAEAIKRQEQQHVERVAQVLETKETPTEAQRAYGPKWQSDRRQVERAIRVAAVAFRRWTGKRNLTRAQASEALGIPERTLASWENRWERNRLRFNPRGRAVERSPVEKRNEVIAMFRLMGPHIGATVLRPWFPDMPRREMENMLRRLKFLHGHKRRLQFFTLRWLKPGTAWAMDHCTPPAPIEGIYTRILSIRDLAGQVPLAWSPVPDESAEHVRLVLAALIAEHGAPLLIKKDNGSALNDCKVNGLLEKNGIIGLLSPRATPSYNGACEAGNGSMKLRTIYEAARQGHPGRWTADDCEAARLQALQTARPWGVNGQTPEGVWSKREPITVELRQRFQNSVAYFKEEERKKKGCLPGIELEPDVLASVNRVAIRRALCACRLLEVRRGHFSLPFSS